MKNFKFNKDKIITILLAGFVLISACSCGKQESNDKKESFVVENYQEQMNNNVQKDKTVENESLGNNSQENNIEINVNSQNKETEESSQSAEVIENQITYSEEDNVIINEFASIKNKVATFLNSDNVEEAKDKAKGIFISIVDFLFYGGEIKGIRFDDLTEEGKKNILGLVSDIDSLIIKKFPTYKEDISEVTKNAYIKAGELIKKGTTNIKEFSKEKLGEENYNAIIDAKDELVEYTKDAFSIIGNVSSKLWDSAKEKVKNWYEEFRKN